MDRLQALGFAPVLAPLLHIVPRTGLKLPARVGAVAITSANAVPSIPAALFGLPVYAVGDATAAAARAAGCTRVTSASGDAGDLARLMAGRVAEPVLLLSGAGQGGRLADTLRAAGLPVVRRVAYAARPVPALPAPVRALLRTGGLHGVLFMSGATAAQFVRVLPPGLVPALSGVVAACIALPAADAVRHLPWRALRVSCRPNLVDTLALL